MKYLSILFIAILFISSANITHNNIKEGVKITVKINDSTEITIIQVIELETNLPIYYYSELLIPACNTGECKLINVDLYWDIYGNYYKYTYPKSSPLTKVNHKEFKKYEYSKLHKLLNDKTSKLKDLKFTDLTEKQADKWYKTDGNTSATIKFIDKTKIKGAVKTTHTLWHIANGIAQTKIKEATKKYFSTNNLPSLFKNDPINEGQIIKVMIDFDKFNLTQTQKLINNIEENNISFSKVKSILNKKITDKNLEKQILIGNYFLRNNKQNCRVKKINKSINYSNQ
jgi:hypothetical protein